MRISWKRCMIEPMLQLTTNRMSAIAFNNMPTYVTCDATKRRNRRLVTPGAMKNNESAYNLETVHDGANFCNNKH